MKHTRIIRVGWIERHVSNIKFSIQQFTANFSPKHNITTKSISSSIERVSRTSIFWMIRRRNNILIVLVRRRKRFENIVNYQNVAPVGGEPLPESIVKTRQISIQRNTVSTRIVFPNRRTRENSWKLSCVNFHSVPGQIFLRGGYNEILGIIFERR